MFIMNVSGKMTVIDELKDGQNVFLAKMRDKIYYNHDTSMYMFNLVTKEKKDMNKQNVEDIIPSPDGKQMLINQKTGENKALILCDSEGNVIKTVVEGNEVNGVSWSPNRRLVAYRQVLISNGIESKGLYLYDMMDYKSSIIHLK